jgi:RecA-family ATPase
MSEVESRMLESLKRMKGAELPKVTVDYLTHGATQGERNERLFAATCQLRDAQWPEVEIYNTLTGVAVGDGLTEGEAQRTIQSALQGNARDAIQHGMGGGAPRAPERPRIYTLDEAEALPPPIEDFASSSFLANLYDPSDLVNVVPSVIDSDTGEEMPIGRGAVLTCATWLEKIGEGEIGDLFKGSGHSPGIFIAINPLKDQKAGRKIANIAEYRHALIEFDTISLKQQWQLLKKSKIPCATVSTSGGKSIHALVKINAKDRAEYDAKVKKLLEHFKEYDVDEKNKDPSRLSRFPGCLRGETGNKQELLSLDMGCEGWDEWEMHISDDFPPILSEGELVTLDMKEPPMIVSGLLHRQLSMVLGGGSKTFKSWTLLDLAISVSHGIPFWGFETLQGKVLYVNFEIPDWYFRDRVRMVNEAKGIKIPSDNFHIWNLRGKAQALEVIAPKFIKLMANANFSVVILDPIYKTLGNRDENAAGDINSLMNEMEEIALKTGAAVVFAAHFSKGNQSSKNSIDRISGSGVFARSPDTILVMTEHEKDNHFTVEPTVRNYLSPDPFVIKMDFPLFVREQEIDPKKLKGAPGRPTHDVMPDLMEIIGNGKDHEQKDVIKEMEERGFSKSTVRRRLNELRKEGRIIRETRSGKSSILRKSNKIDYSPST